MTVIRRIIIIYCSVLPFLVHLINAKVNLNETRITHITQSFSLTNRLGIDRKLSIEEEYQFQLNFIRMLEMTLDFFKSSLLLYNQIDDIMNMKEKDYFDQEFAKHVKKYNKMDQVQVPAEEFENAMKILTSQAENLMKKTAEDSQKILQTSQESTNILLELSAHVKKTNMLTDIDPKDSDFENIDEFTLKLKGESVVKTASVLLGHLRNIHKIADKLEGLGYYNTTFKMDSLELDEGTRPKIIENVESLEVEKKTAFEFLEKTKSILGPINLLAYATETHQIIDKVKLPQMAQMIKKWESETFEQKFAKIIQSSPSTSTVNMNNKERDEL